MKATKAMNYCERFFASSLALVYVFKELEELSLTLTVSHSPPSSRQERIHAHCFVLGPELGIQFTYSPSI